MVKSFQIGGFSFQIISREKITIPENFLKFQISNREIPSFTYQMFLSPAVFMQDEEVLTVRDDLIVYKTKIGEGRLLRFKGQKAYANYRETDAHAAEIIVENEAIEDPVDTLFTSLFALERRMIVHGVLILHCAYIECRGKGILFSAPSGVGKSTQAALWEKYRGSEIVNGDRTLLRKKEGKWLACAWPVCGSSDICKRMDISVYAIVMLRQGKENSVVRLSPAKAFRQLYPQMTINQWNPEFIQAAINGIENLILQVPVWQLTCDMTEDVVKCLEAAIFPDTTIKMR